MPYKLTYQKGCHMEVFITNTDDECIEALARLSRRVHPPKEAQEIAVRAAFFLTGLLPFPNSIHGVKLECISEQEAAQWQRVFSGIS